MILIFASIQQEKGVVGRFYLNDVYSEVISSRALKASCKGCVANVCTDPTIAFRVIPKEIKVCVLLLALGSLLLVNSALSLEHTAYVSTVKRQEKTHTP